MGERKKVQPIKSVPELSPSVRSAISREVDVRMEMHAERIREEIACAAADLRKASLRDQFRMAALTGMLANSPQNEPWLKPQVAREMADLYAAAMLVDVGGGLDIADVFGLPNDTIRPAPPEGSVALLPCISVEVVPREQVGKIHGEEDCLNVVCNSGVGHHWELKHSVPKAPGDTSAEHEAERMNLGVWLSCMHCDEAWAELAERGTDA